MFIYVAYKDAPELSIARKPNDPVDTAVEKILLVNPDCPVRIMLEYIRKKCRLGIFTQFDLCDESGCLMGLFNLQTYAYATEQFEHKKTYYIIVLKLEPDKHWSVLPQLNHENRIYFDLKMRVKKHLMSGEAGSPLLSSGKPATTVPPPPKATSTVLKGTTKKKVEK